MLRMHQKVLIWLAAGGFNLLGLIWLYSFIVSGYRGHWAYAMVPAGIISLILSYGLICMKLSSVFSLTFFAAGTLFAAVYMQVAKGVIHPILLAIVIVSAIYICLLGPTLFKVMKGEKHQNSLE